VPGISHSIVLASKQLAYRDRATAYRWPGRYFFRGLIWSIHCDQVRKAQGGKRPCMKECDLAYGIIPCNPMNPAERDTYSIDWHLLCQQKQIRFSLTIVVHITGKDREKLSNYEHDNLSCCLTNKSMLIFSLRKLGLSAGAAFPLCIPCGQESRGLNVSLGFLFWEFTPTLLIS
jgi:hypothetical protein